MSNNYDKKEWMKEILIYFLELMHVEQPIIRIDNEDENKFNISLFSGEDDGRLIGKNGDTLEAISYIFNKILNNKFSDCRVEIDISGYREKKDSKLKEKVSEIIRSVENENKEGVINNLNPRERRIVHITVKEFGNIISRSEGTGLIKDVVISSN